MIILQPVLQVHRNNYFQFFNQNVKQQLIGFTIAKQENAMRYKQS